MPNLWASNVVLRFGKAKSEREPLLECRQKNYK